MRWGSRKKYNIYILYYKIYMYFDIFTEFQNNSVLWLVSPGVVCMGSMHATKTATWYPVIGHNKRITCEMYWLLSLYNWSWRHNAVDLHTSGHNQSNDMTDEMDSTLETSPRQLSETPTYAQACQITPAVTLHTVVEGENAGLSSKVKQSNRRLIEPATFWMSLLPLIKFVIIHIFVPWNVTINVLFASW